MKTKHFEKMRTVLFRRAAFTFLSAVICIISIEACIKLEGSPTRSIEQFIMEYPPPEFSGMSQADTSLQVKRFSATQEYGSPSMLYSPGPYKLESYDYFKWRASPASMVTDFLTRDLRKSGLVRAVFGHREDCDCRFALDGSIQKFLEVDENGSQKAVLALNLTLVDLSKKDLAQKIVMQKEFRSETPYGNRTPQGLAGAMSKDMEKISREAIPQIHKAVMDRLQSGSSGGENSNSR